MKYAAFLTIALWSFSSHAVEFNKRTALPVELQDRIAAAIEEKCPNVIAVVEASTKERVEITDQGTRDSFFTSVFEGDVIRGNDPYPVEITVLSSKFDVSNPAIDPLSIESVKGLACR